MASYLLFSFSELKRGVSLWLFRSLKVVSYCCLCQLEWIRSQVREFTTAERQAIVERQKKDASRTDLLRVGVIDSGVDIAHKDLQNQIDYRIVDGRLAGAGVDVMGGGPSGTHVLVDPTIFAFGAKEIKDGLIVDPAESPLQLLKQANDIFVEHFYNAIHTDPELKESLFAKIPKKSISLAGALEITEYTSLDQQIESADPKKATNDPKMLEAMKIMDFSTSPGSYAPNIMDYASGLEHGKRFLETVKSSMEFLDAETGFNKNFDNLMTYMKGKSEGMPVGRRETIQVLKRPLDMVLWGIDAFDPFWKLEQTMNSTERFRGKSATEVAEIIIAEYKAQYEELLKNPDFSAKDRKTIHQAIKNQESIRSAAKALDDLKKDPAAYEKMRSNLRRYVIRTQHPYLSQESNTNSHATHVSGVIAHQNEKVRIVPIRVTTSSVALSKVRQDLLTEQFLNDFREWLKLPIVAELINVISKEYSGLKMNPARAESMLKAYLKSPKGTLDAVFISDVLKAVEAAGQQQLKLANVSLGTTFQKDHTLAKKAESMVNDLFSEFVRYKIGETMNTKAPGTLFVVATGNDGGWLDGVTKTGFPVGITSSRFLDIAKAKGLKDTPNNSVKNILAVGSVNVNGTLTAFTNILIDPKVPQIFSTGEEIYSSVPAKDSSKATELVGKEFAGILEVERLDKPDFSAAPKKREDFSKKQERGDIFLNIKDAMAMKVHLEAPLGRENMSGTSMATPTVTGILANFLVQKMAKEHISSKDAYLHPSMMPEQVVKDVMAMAKVSPHSSVVTIKMLVEGIKKWGTAKEATMQKQAVKKIFHPTAMSCEAIFR